MAFSKSKTHPAALLNQSLSSLFSHVFSFFDGPVCQSLFYAGLLEEGAGWCVATLLREDSGVAVITPVISLGVRDHGQHIRVRLPASESPGSLLQRPVPDLTTGTSHPVDNNLSK